MGSWSGRRYQQFVAMANCPNEVGKKLMKQTGWISRARATIHQGHWRALRVDGAGEASAEGPTPVSDPDSGRVRSQQRCGVIAYPAEGAQKMILHGRGVSWGPWNGRVRTSMRRGACNVVAGGGRRREET